MNSEYGICNLSLVPIRVEPSDKSEILSYLLFGDCFEVLEVSPRWVLIHTAFDGYAGWIDHKQFQSLNAAEFDQYGSHFRTLGLGVYQPLRKLASNETLYLTSGSCIPLSEDRMSFSIAGEAYEFVNPPVFAAGQNLVQHIDQYSRFFLHAPYLWGGKSLFGIDCSGFTQIVFKMLGVKLKRDASQQAIQGCVVNFLQEAKAGDLAFFDNEEGRIVHVGIMLNEHQIIHASGRVKIDPIDDEGIFSTDLNRHSHKLRIIKRFV